MGTEQHFFLLIGITEGVYTDLLHIIMIFKFVTATNWSGGKTDLKKYQKGNILEIHVIKLEGV